MYRPKLCLLTADIFIYTDTTTPLHYKQNKEYPMMKQLTLRRSVFPVHYSLF